MSSPRKVGITLVVPEGFKGEKSFSKLVGTRRGAAWACMKIRQCWNRIWTVWVEEKNEVKGRKIQRKINGVHAAELV